MFKNLTLIFTVLLSVSVISSKSVANSRCQNPDSLKTPLISISPAKPLIEKDIYGYYLNFDLTIKNQCKHVLELSSMELAILDGSGKLVMRKFLNRDVQSPGIAMLGNTTIKPGESIHIPNPFHTFPPDVTIAKLKYGLFFNFADTQTQKENNKQRLPVDFDESVIKTIIPQVYIAKNEYYLPLKGKIIVWDGHDFNSHNRRSPLGAAYMKVKDITVNSHRYAYDLITIDAVGSMYHGSPFEIQNWYVFGKPVYVAADGKVVAVQNNIPDNEFSGKTVKSPKMPTDTDKMGMGNYVIVDHGNGEYSELLHMEKGSIRVKRGDIVKAGQQIGAVGFSGDVIYPHLHYTITNGIKDLVSEGIPSYFNSYKLYRGNLVLAIKRSRIESGDIVESEK